MQLAMDWPQDLSASVPAQWLETVLQYSETGPLPSQSFFMRLTEQLVQSLLTFMISFTHVL